MPRYADPNLLAVPIEYIGGNSLVLAVCLAIVAFGLVSWSPAINHDGRQSPTRRREPGLAHLGGGASGS